jgi:hypothetical protein
MFMVGDGVVAGLFNTHYREACVSSEIICGATLAFAT